MTTRRDFVRTAAGVGTGVAFGGLAGARPLDGAPAVLRPRTRPVAIASRNGESAVARAVEGLGRGEPVVDAVVEGVTLVELDPADMSVGYGGLPNAEGVVQLDASVMSGPTRGAGAVGALEGIKTPSQVALQVMRYTDHIFLVGEGAQRFALSMGFQLDDLLTDEARRRWITWRHNLSPRDNYLSPEQSGEPVEGLPESMADAFDRNRVWGTINCNAVDREGNLAGVTTTSGLSYKIPGRVGDSPLIGAGLYVDNDVGACGSTGRGEAVIKVCGSHAVVELMRGGMHPTDAALEVLRRIVRFTVEDRLLNERGHPAFNVSFYAVNKAGDYGSAAIWSGSRFAVDLDGEGRVADSAYLLER